jgi:hypothetical protein
LKGPDFFFCIAHEEEHRKKREKEKVQDKISIPLDLSKGKILSQAFPLR